MYNTYTTPTPCMYYTKATRVVNRQWTVNLATADGGKGGEASLPKHTRHKHNPNTQATCTTPIPYQHTPAEDSPVVWASAPRLACPRLGSFALSPDNKANNPPRLNPLDIALQVGLSKRSCSQTPFQEGALANRLHQRPSYQSVPASLTIVAATTTTTTTTTLTTDY